MATSFTTVEAITRNFKNTSKKRNTTVFKDSTPDIFNIQKSDTTFENGVNSNLESLQNDILTNSNLINELTSTPTQIFSDKEIPTGNIDGVNSSFTLSHTPIEGSEHIYLNGLLQESGVENDYIISNSNITFLTPPEEDFKIRCTYYYTA